MIKIKLYNYNRFYDLKTFHGNFIFEQKLFQKLQLFKCKGCFSSFIKFYYKVSRVVAGIQYLYNPYPLKLRYFFCVIKILSQGLLSTSICLLRSHIQIVQKLTRVKIHIEALEKVNALVNQEM